jgi:Aspartate/tyrosine/aromatic aminotransferase
MMQAFLLPDNKHHHSLLRLLFLFFSFFLYLIQPNTVESLSISSNKNSMSTTATTATSTQLPAAASLLSTSTRVQETLDPCVVLMKELLAKYQHKWNKKTHENGNENEVDNTNHKMYSLAQGIVHWSPPPSVSQAMISAIQQQDQQEQELLHQYAPDEGLPDLIEALKKKFKRENNLPCSNNNQSDHDDDDDDNDDASTRIDVIVTSGANQAYMNCICTLLSEGEQCIVFRPYYFNHVMAVQMTRGNEALRVGPMDNDNGYPCLDWLKEQLENNNNDNKTKKIKMVTIVNPGNPTGVSIPTEILREIVNLCKLHSVWVVMDCTYEHFDHNGSNSFIMDGADDDDGKSDNDNDIPTLGFHCFDDENVVNIFSFSKGYAMAGYRVGAITINTTTEQGQDAYRQMVKVQDTIPICASRISQIAALGALSAGRQWVLDKVRSLDGSRELILDAMSSLECCMGGTGAMYIMGKLPDGMDDLVFAERLIEKYGVAVIPGNFCGLPGWIRVCYSNLPFEDCKVAASRLKSGILDLCFSE